jgi:unsaturated rhamnogalacturonyl hydrolase
VRAAPFAFLLGIAGVVPGTAQPATRFDGFTSVEWSERLARAEMDRRGDSLVFRADGKASWNYTSGFFARALHEVGGIPGAESLRAYGDRIVDSFIAPDGTIRGYLASEYNLDQVTPGQVVVAQYALTGDERFRKAAETLRRQLASQPRTFDGGFWHKLIYPDQMWLDGLFMSGPFYARYGAVFNDRAASADAAQQIILADHHLYDPGTGLYFHAWDAKRVQPWASPVTGCSPSFWGRAIGWYAMATVDELDSLPAAQPSTDAVRAIFRRIAAGIVRWQDPRTGAWWQVVDQGGRPGNYLESSASSMFVYALAKGVGNGQLPRDPFMSAAIRGYTALVHEFIRADGQGRIGLTHCCSVAGLNNLNAAGRVRDGSFAYYVSEPVVDNDLKAVSAFILAGLEVQRMLGPVPSTPSR